MSDDILKVKELIDKTDAIVIGAGSGLSTAAGYPDLDFINILKILFLNITL